MKEANNVQNHLLVAFIEYFRIVYLLGARHL